MITRLLVIVATVLTVITASIYHYSANRVVFTCSGEYRSEIQLDSNHLISTLDIVITFFNQNRVYSAVAGSVTHNGKKMHLSREIIYEYKAVDQQNGIYHIVPKEIHNGGANTAQSKILDHYLLGIEKEGRMVRIWKLSDDVMLIGNIFSPIMSCSKM